MHPAPTTQILGVPMTAGALAVRHVLPYQRDFFLQRFGREPQQHDPVFFDFQASTMKPMPGNKLVPYLLQILEQTDGHPMVIQELRHAKLAESYPDDLERWITGKSPMMEALNWERYPLYPSIYERIQSVQLDAFQRKYHRIPQPNDPVIFDPESSTPRPYPTSASIQRILALVESYLDTDINKPTLLEDLARITYPVLSTLLTTIRDDA